MKKRRNWLTRGSVRIMVWFLLGQIVQFGANALAIQITYTNDQLTFCFWAGVIVTAALFAGFRMAVAAEKEEEDAYY